MSEHPQAVYDRLNRQRRRDYWLEVNGVWTQAVLDVPLRIPEHRETHHWDCVTHGLYCLKTMPPLPKRMGYIALAYLLWPVILIGMLMLGLAATHRDVVGTGSTVSEGSTLAVLPVDAGESSATSPAEMRANEAVAPASIHVSSKNPVTINAPEPRVSVPVPVNMEATLRSAAAHFGVNGDQLVAVAVCESGLRADAVGDHGAAVGLMQFHLPTFTANAQRYFGYPVGDMRHDPQASAMVAAWMWTRGQQSQWTCWRTLYG